MLKKQRGSLVAPRTVGLVVLTTILLAVWHAPCAIAVDSCPNEDLRTGLSGHLPDCRAYELVTPTNSNGRLFSELTAAEKFDLFPTELASPLHDSLIFSTEGSSLQSPPGGGGRAERYDVYEAQRTESGWQTVRHVTPAPYESILPLGGGVSADHGYSFVHVGPTNNESGDFGSLYVGGDTDYLGDSSGHFELTGIGSLGSERWAQGRYIAPGGTHVIFTTGKVTSGSQWCAHALSKGRPCIAKQLEPDAAPTGTGAIYDRSADGPTHVVSLLPGEVPLGAGEDAEYQGTSSDGSAVAFKVNDILYVRAGNGTLSESTEKVTDEASEFGGISEDGRYLFYVRGGNIYRFNTETEGTDVVDSSGDGQIVNVAADGSDVYFISQEQLDGTEGTKGQPNLYVWSSGSPKYIATVLPSDLEGTPGLTNWTKYVVAPQASPEVWRGPGAESSRVTPDGSTLAFESAAQLTSYPNNGHTQVYIYRVGAGSVQCVSCNPLVASATGDARFQEIDSVGSPVVIHNLTVDGRRVFFETDEGLVAGDADGVNDVYEWQQPAAEGDAELSLITSGESVEYPHIGEGFGTNMLFGVTPTGSDVFFRSQDALTLEAGVDGAAAIYDARVGGGFPEPATPFVCVEEGCRSPLGSPLPLGRAISPALQGGGNVVPSKKSKKKKHRNCHRHHENRHRHCGRKRASKSARVSSVNPTGRGSAASSGGSAAQSEESSGDSAGTTSPTVGAIPAAPSSTEFEGFGIKSVAAELSTPVAADHPDFTATLKLKGASATFSAKVKDVVVEPPPGLYGNPNLTPRCRTGDFLGGACPIDSQIGISRTKLVGIPQTVTLPVFNLEPPHPQREVARFGFLVVTLPVFIDVSVRTAGDYGVTATVHDAPSQFPLESAETTFWGDPADPSHDEQRMTATEAFNCPGNACEAPGGKRSSGLPPIGFMTNPSACQSQETRFSVTSYQLPGQIFSATAPMEPIIGCQGVPFVPSFEAHPTNHRAGAPTGLNTVLRLPQSSDPAVRSTATMREARVTLPEGMGISSSAADGLAACSDEQVHFHEELNAECPDASKLGTAEIVSPALSEPLEGAIYQRTPEPGHLFRLWLVTDQLGLHVKLPGEVKPDQNTGQLTAVFSDLPQVPVEEIDLDVWGGPRAPLKNPDACGTYSTAFSFAPHSQDPPVTGTTSMTIDEGCGAAGFSPQLHGGATNPVAGGFSPFLLDLTREDGEQELGGFEVNLPKGVLAKLKGVPLCPDSQAGSGACPANSKIGSLTASAGPGPDPLWIPQPGKDQPAVYLAGPYKGAPYSAVSVVPAQAGPFDLGNVVVRSALVVDPETAQATVKTDPLPQFVEGVPVIYRRLHVVIDRPEFTLNPTNCSELAITSNVSSTAGAVAHPSERFQVDGCKALKFKPKLTLKLKGGTKRADYPALTATLRARKGDANIGRVSVALPHSEFLAQEHIVTICTRVQFAADKCPKGSVYGKAKAWTPLLDKPLEGPVYLRSSSNPLPDLVMDLKGQIEIAVPGRIDSKNAGIRATFETVPDAPISKFVMRMKGGKKGLLTNSQDICVGKHRATVKMQAQNGRAINLRPVLAARCKRR